MAVTPEDHKHLFPIGMMELSSPLESQFTQQKMLLVSVAWSDRDACLRLLFMLLSKRYMLVQSIPAFPLYCYGYQWRHGCSIAKKTKLEIDVSQTAIAT
jgi:hypothetical protein